MELNEHKVAANADDVSEMVLDKFSPEIVRSNRN